MLIHAPTPLGLCRAATLAVVLSSLASVVTAQLADGREMEDAELLQGAEHRGEIDVQLVQLQVLVVDRDGDPVGDLKAEDFEIRENGAWRPAKHLHVSEDVPLVLGIAIDSSESMYFVWRQLHDVVRAFLEGALADDDRAFLVDFDDTVRPIQPLTASRPLLKARLHRLLAEGGAALNDGILFSLLQFRSEPGRRRRAGGPDDAKGSHREERAAARGASIVVGPLIRTAVLLALWAPAEDAARAQSETTREAQSVEADISLIAALEGAWAWNEKVSEDPIQKTINLWRDPDRMSTTLLGLATSLGDRVGRLQITVGEGQVRLRNAQYEVLAFPADGSPVADQYGNRHRALVLPGTLEIETARPGWLLIETLYVQAGQLHRVIEIQSGRFPNLRFLTVYDRSGREPRSTSSTGDDMNRFARPAAIRIVPPHRGHHELLTGRVEVGTLIVDSTIGKVDFFLDGRRRRRVGKAPFRTRINLADPPREQTLEVRAYSVRGAYVGDDRVVLNRFDPPFAVRIGAITPRETDVKAVQVETRIAVPRGATLERVEFYRGEQLAETLDNLTQHPVTGGFRAVTGNVSTHDLSPQDYVRVTARLVDGRELEDAELLQGAEFKGEIDVQLIHLQVLVVDADGNPVGGLRAADFRIVEDGEQRTVEELQRAGDVPLVLGMAIDSSASMKPVWNQLKSVAGAFLESSLTEADRAFLVDFDETIRLLQPLTGSAPALRRRLERLVANGGTALNDGILFSLVQYGNEPGRRALVVVTDGVDIDSRSEPEQAGAFAERVGIPLYFIDLGRDQIALLDTNTPDGDSTQVPTMRSARSDAHLLRMRQLARRSGGRLFRIDLDLPPPDFVAKVHGVFDRIKEDLLHQYVLTYYSDRPLGTAIEPEVRTVRTDLEVRSALPLHQSDDG